MHRTTTSPYPGANDRDTSLPYERLLTAPETLLFSSSDVDETRSIVQRVMNPHRLAQESSGERLRARMHHVALGDICLSRLRYGAQVQIEPDPLASFFLIQMPVQGTAVIENNGQQVNSCNELASVLSPDDRVRMRWDSSNEQLMLRIPRALLERTLAGHLGRPLTAPLRFEPGFRWRQNTAWRCALSYFLDCATLHPTMEQHKIVLKHIEQLAASVLLSSHKHNYSNPSVARRATVLPRHVRRAQDYLQAHAHEPISIEQLAQIAGMSVRSLYSGFKEFLGVSPMNYLRDLRMHQTHMELMSGSASNVAGVALRWGFVHMGRFSNEYKSRYGEAPSQTLKRN